MGAVGHPTQGTARRAGSDEGVGFDTQPLHAGLVAKDAAAAHLATGVNGQHGQFAAMLLDKEAAKGFDKTAFAHAGRASDSYSESVSGMWKAFLKDLLRQISMLRSAAFNQSNCSSKHYRVAPKDTVNVVVGRPVFA